MTPESSHTQRVSLKGIGQSVLIGMTVFSFTMNIYFMMGGMNLSTAPTVVPTNKPSRVL